MISQLPRWALHPLSYASHWYQMHCNFTCIQTLPENTPKGPNPGGPCIAAILQHSGYQVNTEVVLCKVSCGRHWHGGEKRTHCHNAHYSAYLGRCWWGVWAVCKRVLEGIGLRVNSIVCKRQVKIAVMSGFPGDCRVPESNPFHPWNCVIHHIVGIQQTSWYIAKGIRLS